MEARRDAVVYLLILAACLVLFLSVGQLPELPQYRRVGPGFWPKLLLLGIACLAAGGLLRAARACRGAAVPSRPFLGSAPVQLLAVIALSLLYPFAMDFTGFLVATLLFQLVLLALLGLRRPGVMVAAAGLNLGLLYGIFARALHMPLPRGVGFFRTLSLWFY
jgi:hypothetical protein